MIVGVPGSLALAGCKGDLACSVYIEIFLVSSVPLENRNTRSPLIDGTLRVVATWVEPPSAAVTS